jgi:hypothetical protein
MMGEVVRLTGIRAPRKLPERGLSLHKFLLLSAALILLSQFFV